MKKFITVVLFALLLLPQAAFSGNNFIYSINVTNDKETDNVVLDVKSDYKTKIKYKLDESGRRYFDIKDASLKENFSVNYGNASGIEGVIAQQIGSKVRIYIKGDETENIAVNFNNVENQAYPEKSTTYALIMFAAIMAAISRLFAKKKPVKKAQSIQNANSKQVYKELMEKQKQAEDKSKMTLNSLRQRNAHTNIPPYSPMQNPMANPMQRNIQSINDYKKQSVKSRVAM